MISEIHSSIILSIIIIIIGHIVYLELNHMSLVKNFNFSWIYHATGTIIGIFVSYYITKVLIKNWKNNIINNIVEILIILTVKQLFTSMFFQEILFTPRWLILTIILIILQILYTQLLYPKIISDEMNQTQTIQPDSLDKIIRYTILKYILVFIEN